MSICSASCGEIDQRYTIATWLGYFIAPGVLAGHNAISLSFRHAAYFVRQKNLEMSKK